MAKEIKKVILAYSGGLDTSIIIPWLKENYPGVEVICVAGNVGQDAEIVGLEERAKKTGASKLYIEDIQDEFVNDFIFPTLKAGAKYEGYLLGTSFARPPIAKRIVEIAKKEGADAICHGCTGKGNDQVRFELTIKALAPNMKIIAPWRVWDIKSRDQEIDYAEAFKYFSLGALLFNDANCLYKLGDMYLNGYGADKNEKYAFLLYKRALERCQENGMDDERTADAQVRVGKCLLKGIGTKVDVEEAHGLLTFALINFYKRRKTDHFVANLIESTKELIAEAQERLDKETSDYQ